MFQVQIISRGRWTPASPLYASEAEAQAEAEAWKRSYDVRTRIVRDAAWATEARRALDALAARFDAIPRP